MSRSNYPYDLYGRHGYGRPWEYDYYIYGGDGGASSGSNAVSRTKEIPKLHAAAKIDKTKEISKLIQGGANINEVNEDQETALHYAIKYKKIEAMKMLISFGIDTEKKESSGQTARDLIRHDSYVLSELDKFLAVKHKHNIEVVSELLYTIINKCLESPYLPKDLSNIISEYNGSSGSWLEFNINSVSIIPFSVETDFDIPAETPLLGVIAEASTDNVCPYCSIM